METNSPQVVDEQPKAKLKFSWQRDENGNLLPPELQAGVIDKVESSYSKTTSSINDDGSSSTEVIAVKTTSRPKQTVRDVPVWKERSAESLKKALRDSVPQLEALLDQNSNEGDTRLVVNDILTSGLGYERFTELTTEYIVKNEYVDYVVRLDGNVKIVVEVKRVGRKLNVNDLKQAENYAIHSGIKWIVLTNGHVWRLYHLSIAEVPQTDLVFEVSILDDIAEARNKLAYLCRASFIRGEIDTLWSETTAKSNNVVRDAILSDEAIKAIRINIWRATGFKLEDEDVKVAVDQMLV